MIKVAALFDEPATAVPNSFLDLHNNYYDMLTLDAIYHKQERFQMGMGGEARRIHCIVLQYSYFRYFDFEEYLVRTIQINISSRTLKGSFLFYRKLQIRKQHNRYNFSTMRTERICDFGSIFFLLIFFSKHFCSTNMFFFLLFFFPPSSSSFFIITLSYETNDPELRDLRTLYS